ncbi:MAG: tetratricopeptide repeat protein [Gemmatimonadaceae bacterium]|nr:tetratricopeptide repeat protein [Gemmatimonadaceae bacterium]
MADVAKLKKKAAEFEASKKLDKAIATYREILDAWDAGEDDGIDIALYNRVGDLLQKSGDSPGAVTLYERAVDLYAEGGFFNNAIALCSKILRQSPGRASIYYKLGKISAAKGFTSDAKKNFLEYAERMQKAGNANEAFRALGEFADLVPDQDDVRAMLADQLLKADRKGEALEQLAVLHAHLAAAGQSDEAAAIRNRIHELDPTVELTAARLSRETKAADLVFLDLDAPAARASRLTKGIPLLEEPVSAPRVARTLTPTPPAPPAAPPPTPPSGLELIDLDAPGEESSPVPEHALEGMGSSAMDGASEPVDAAIGAIDGLEITHVGEAAQTETSGALLGLEPTSFGTFDAPEAAPLSASEFAELDLSTVEEASTPRASTTRDLALGGDLPLLDLDMGADGHDDEPPSGGDLDLILPDLDDAPVPAAAISDAPIEAPALDALEETIELDPEPAIPLEVIAADESPTDFNELTDVGEAPPPRRVTSSIPALADDVPTLKARVTKEQTNWALRRTLAEAMLDDGDRAGGLAELEQALIGFERAGDLDSARSVADEIIRLDPSSVRHLQKRVEFAFRANDQAGLAQAYIDLADALFRDGQAEKARAVYRRVLEINPDDIRAQAALSAFIDEPPSAPRPATPVKGTPSKRYTTEVKAVVEPPTPAPQDEDGYVSLGDWLREDDEPKSTRMVVDEQEPTGDEQADFQDMLRKFKQGVADNVEDEDHEAHYDLGVAYKEMGLLDEAIAEFQRALRGTDHRVRTFEALGQCFLEKQQLPVAATILQRALAEPGVKDEQLVGVLYLLGYLAEAQGDAAQAKAHYERVFAVDIQFRDVGERLNALAQAAR